MDVSLFSDLANKEGDWFIFWRKFWPASLLYSVLFSVFLKMYLLIVILWRKSTRECFICSKLHLSRVVPRQWMPPVTSARTVIKRNFYVCANLRKTVLTGASEGLQATTRWIPPAAVRTGQTVPSTAGISTHGWWLWIGCICLHPKPYRFLLILFFILRFVSSFMPLESGMNDQPLTGWNIAEVHLIFKLQNCFYLPWGRPIFLMFKK